MIKEKTARRLRLGLILFAVGTAPVMAQDGGPQMAQPLLTDMILYSQAFGLEMVGLRLDLAEISPAPINPNVLDEVVKLNGDDYARFAGTLEERDPDLDARLLAALTAVADAARAGQSVEALLPDARALLSQAYDAVIDPEVQATPLFQATIVASLLLNEGGVSEAWDEATAQPWEYPSGWVALQRVKELWASLAPSASPENLAAGQEMIDELDVLYADPEPPADIMAQNPDEAETPAQGLAGVLESVVNADLYAGRDLGALANELAQTTLDGCDAYAAGDEALGDEAILAVRTHYLGQLDGTLALLAPDIRNAAIEGFAPLVEDFRTEALAAAEALRGHTDRAEVADTLLRQALVLIYPVDPVPVCQALATAMTDAVGAVGGVAAPSSRD